MTRTFEVYRAAHLLPEGPYSETEKAELLQALWYIRAALGDEAPDHGEIYARAWDQVNDTRAAE